MKYTEYTVVSNHREESSNMDAALIIHAAYNISHCLYTKVCCVDTTPTVSYGRLVPHTETLTVVTRPPEC